MVEFDDGICLAEDQLAVDPVAEADDMDSADGAFAGAGGDERVGLAGGVAEADSALLALSFFFGDFLDLFWWGEELFRGFFIGGLSGGWRLGIGLCLELVVLVFETIGENPVIFLVI